MNGAITWWFNHLGVLVGGLCIGAGSAWIGTSLALLGTYFIMENYGFLD